MRSACAETLQKVRDQLAADERPPELFLCDVRQGKIVKCMFSCPFRAHALQHMLFRF